MTTQEAPIYLLSWCLTRHWKLSPPSSQTQAFIKGQLQALCLFWIFKIHSHHDLLKSKMLKKIGKILVLLFLLGIPWQLWFGKIDHLHTVEAFGFFLYFTVNELLLNTWSSHFSCAGGRGILQLPTPRSCLSRNTEGWQEKVALVSVYSGS